MSDPQSFVERRHSSSDKLGTERRQFADRRDHMRAEVREFADAVDRYKVRHHRKFITFDELLDVLVSLGYRKVGQEAPLSYPLDGPLADVLPALATPMSS